MEKFLSFGFFCKPYRRSYCNILQRLFEISVQHLWCSCCVLFSCLKPEHGKKHGAMDPVPAVQEMGPPLLETAAPLPSAQVISAFNKNKMKNILKKSKQVWQPENVLCLINFQSYGLYVLPFSCVLHCDCVLCLLLIFTLMISTGAKLYLMKT